MLNFDFLEKSLVVSSTHFAYDLKKKTDFSCYILLKFHSLIAFTS